MFRNLLIVIGCIVGLYILSQFNIPLLTAVVSVITSVLAFFGAATICLVGAPVCIPAIGIGGLVLLTGLGLSVNQALAIALLVLAVGGYGLYVLYKIVRKRYKKK